MAAAAARISLICGRWVRRRRACVLLGARSRGARPPFRPNSSVSLAASERRFHSLEKTLTCPIPARGPRRDDAGAARRFDTCDQRPLQLFPLERAHRGFRRGGVNVAPAEVVVCGHDVMLDFAGAVRRTTAAGRNRETTSRTAGSAPAHTLHASFTIAASDRERFYYARTFNIQYVAAGR